MVDLKKNYPVPPGYAESGRLYLQHWFWSMQLRYELHPDIVLPEHGPHCVADLGCGNGAWLLSLDEGLDGTPERIGFDISSAHFPAPEDLPKGMQLKVLDAFTEDLPVELLGKFDVVHVRAFGSVVKNNDPAPLIQNAVKMLKPGGYFQWDEMDFASTQATAPSPAISTNATQKMVDTAVLTGKNAMNSDYSWVSNLGSLFNQHGLDVLQDTKMDVKRELRKPLTDSLLIAFDRSASLAVEDGRVIGTNVNWATLWDAAVAEIQGGVSMVMDLLICVGRKRN